MFGAAPLPYDAGALAPVINSEIMTLHHTKHHQAYVTNLNAAMDKYADAEAKGDIATMIALQVRTSSFMYNTMQQTMKTRRCTYTSQNFVVCVFDVPSPLGASFGRAFLVLAQATSAT